MFFFNKKSEMPSAETALAGRDESMPVPAKHYVNGNAMAAPFPEGMEMAMFGMGCFWGAERKFWQAQGVYSTAVGYAAGYTPNPTYEEVSKGSTGHYEAVLIRYDPNQITYNILLEIFWYQIDPTDPGGQFVDRGSQYKTAIFYQSEDHRRLAAESKVKLEASGIFNKPIVTQILPAGKFFPAEASGGLKALKALAAPFGGVRFCPTGGITAETAPEWLAHPAVLCVGGSWVVQAGETDLAAISARARLAAELRAAE